MTNLFAIVGASVLLAVKATPSDSTYRIELSNGTEATAIDLPVQRGSVVTFHSRKGGPMTGVPAEMVVKIAPSGTGSTSYAPAHSDHASSPKVAISTSQVPSPLKPGEMIEIGSRGNSGLAPPSTAPAVAGGMSSGTQSSAAGVGNGNTPALNNPNVNVNAGGVTNTPAMTPSMMLAGPDGVPRAASSTDLSRTLATQNPVGSNGFPATNTGAPTVVGPNGTPTLAPGLPGSSALAVGANGTPITGTTGAQTTIGPNGTPILVQSTQPTTGPNGTPALVQPGQPGSTSPANGPNGTPTLAQPGQPGSMQPVIGPNGTPVLAQPGQPGSGASAPNTAPNGTPAAAAPGSVPAVPPAPKS